MESKNDMKLPLNPCDSANYVSRMVFAWVLPFIKNCYSNVLKLEDVFQPMTCDKSGSLGDRLES